MPALHLVNRASALAPCLSAAAEDDAVLLIEDGVYAAAADVSVDRPLYALENDVRARGLADRLGDNAAVVSDAEFVTLVERHQPVVTWR